jgi:hypothetical protein
MRNWFRFSDESSCVEHEKGKCKYNHTITDEFIIRYCVTHENMHMRFNPNRGRKNVARNTQSD